MRTIFPLWLLSSLKFLNESIQLKKKKAIVVPVTDSDRKAVMLKWAS